MLGQAEGGGVKSKNVGEEVGGVVKGSHVFNVKLEEAKCRKRCTKRCTEKSGLERGFTSYISHKLKLKERRKNDEH